MNRAIQPAARRTFYIERYGQDYQVVRVWEKGAEMKPEDMEFIFSRVMKTNPDLRLMAEQMFGMLHLPNGMQLEAPSGVMQDALEVALELSQQAGYGLIVTAQGYRNRMEQLSVALRAVLASTLVTNEKHDWRTCPEPSCVMARRALGEEKGNGETQAPAGTT